MNDASTPAMTRVHLLQLLCPLRHCIVATAYEPAQMSPADAERFLEAQRTRLGLNPWCGICHSRALRYEDGETAWATMEEALPALAELQARNLATAAHFQRRRSSAN